MAYNYRESFKAQIKQDIDKKRQELEEMSKDYDDFCQATAKIPEGLDYQEISKGPDSGNKCLDALTYSRYQFEDIESFYGIKLERTKQSINDAINELNSNSVYAKQAKESLVRLYDELLKINGRRSFEGNVPMFLQLDEHIDNISKILKSLGTG